MTPFKTTMIRAIILAIVLTAPLLLAENGTGLKQLPDALPAPTTDRITSTALSQLKSSVKPGFPQAQWSKQAPQGETKNYDIYKDSVILQQGDSHTVLPLNSIVYLPDSLKQKVVSRPYGSFVSWPQFYIKNRNWIFTHEISLKQAQGVAPLKDGVMKQFERINRLVVAIHQNNPISILSSSQAAK